MRDILEFVPKVYTIVTRAIPMHDVEEYVSSLLVSVDPDKARALLNYQEMLKTMPDDIKYISVTAPVIPMEYVAKDRSNGTYILNGDPYKISRARGYIRIARDEIVAHEEDFQSDDITRQLMEIVKGGLL